MKKVIIVTLKITANPRKVFFLDIDKLLLKFIWKGKRTNIAENNLKKKNKVKGITIPNFKTYYLTTVLKTVCYLLAEEQTHRSIEQI